MERRAAARGTSQGKGLMNRFEDVVQSGLKTHANLRLLSLFVRAVPAGPHAAYHFAGARLVPVLSLNKVVSPTLCFERLKEEADQIDGSWDFILLLALAKPDGTLPTAEEAERHLSRRADEAWISGDLSTFLVFDRNAQPLELTAERRLH